MAAKFAAVNLLPLTGMSGQQLIALSARAVHPSLDPLPRLHPWLLAPTLLAMSRLWAAVYSVAMRDAG